MVCSPHRNQLAGIGYLATINAYRDMPIAAPQFQTSYSQPTPPQFGYRSLFPTSDLSGKVQSYKQFQGDSKAYDLPRIYIREYITKQIAPEFGYQPIIPENPPNGGQSEKHQGKPSKTLDSLLHSHVQPPTAHQPSNTQTTSYRSDIEYNPRPRKQKTISEPQQSTTQTEPSLRHRIQDSLQQLLQQNENELSTNATTQATTENQLKPMRGILYV